MVETMDWSGFDPESEGFQSTVLPDCTTSPRIVLGTYII